jgi:hypothetical protein
MGRVSLICGLLLQPDSGIAVIQKFNACLFQSGDYPAERFRPGRNRPVETFHAAYGPERHFRFPGKFSLGPAQKAARRSDMPAVYDDQTKTLSRLP